MIKISADSWHYKLAFESVASIGLKSTGYSETRYNLCPYVRHLSKVFLILFVFSAYFAAIPFQLHELVTTGWLHNLTHGGGEVLVGLGHPIFSVWYFISNLISALLAICAGVGGVLFVIYCILLASETTVEWCRKKAFGPTVFRSSEDKPASTLRLLNEWIKATHEKICPQITIVYPKEEGS